MTKRVQGDQAGWKQHTGAGLDPTQRAILPVFDTNTDDAGEALAYKVAAGSPAAVIVVLGRNLADIVLVDAGTFVKVGVAPGGVAPAVVSILAVDGGVTPDTIGPCAAAGTEWFVVGSALLNQDDYGQSMQQLTQQLQAAAT